MGNFEKIKILITGGSGFIGLNVQKSLQSNPIYEILNIQYVFQLTADDVLMFCLLKTFWHSF